MNKDLWSHILLVYRPIEALFAVSILAFEGLHADTVMAPFHRINISRLTILVNIRNFIFTNLLAS